MWWQHVSLLWWSLVSARCEVYEEISVLMMKRSVGNCISTTIWFFSLALFRAGLRQNESEMALSSNHRITTFEIGLHHKRTMLSTPGHADNWNGKAYATQRHMTQTFCYYSAPVANWKWVYHSAGPCIILIVGLWVQHVWLLWELDVRFK